VTRGGRNTVLAVGAALLAGLLLAASTQPADARITSQNGSDWQHALTVTLQLRRHPPKVPVVILLGDSLARESTVDDASWSDQTLRYGAGRVLTYNLASRSQSFIQTRDLVNLLPPARVLVLIAVDPGRFMSGPAASVLRIDQERAAKHDQHHYWDRVRVSRSRRRELLREWQRRAVRLFPARYMTNLLRLDATIRACQGRGFRVALVDMPMDDSVIGKAMDRVRGTYRHGCRSLATLYKIPFIDYTRRAGLVSADFYDLAHMMATGGAKWQRVLAKKSAELLRRYGWVE